MNAGDWRSRGVCRTNDPDRFFVPGGAQHQAKIVCLPCPVQVQCLAEALDHRIEFGVWGGMTERERRALLRRRPDVGDWAELLKSASRHHESVVHEHVRAGESRPGSAQMGESRFSHG